MELDDLRHNLSQVQDRIAKATAQAHRDPAAITLVAVTKVFAASPERCLHIDFLAFCSAVSGVVLALKQWSG